MLSSMSAIWFSPRARRPTTAWSFVVPGGICSPSCFPNTPSNTTFVALPRSFGPTMVKATLAAARTITIMIMTASGFR